MVFILFARKSLAQIFVDKWLNVKKPQADIYAEKMAQEFTQIVELMADSYLAVLCYLSAADWDRGGLVLHV